MIWARSRHLWSDCLALSITWPPSHVSKFMFEKKNEPFCYLSHPEVFFKHQSWAFPGSNPSCALWPRQPSLPIKQISKSLSLSISDLHSPPLSPVSRAVARGKWTNGDIWRQHIDTSRPRLWADCAAQTVIFDAGTYYQLRVVPGMLMLIKSASVLMCYSRIKRWNGFLHCSLGTGHPVLAPVHFTVRVVRVTYCYSHSPWLSCLYIALCDVYQIFWIFSSVAPSYSFFIPTKLMLIETNCYISDQSSDVRNTEG